MKLYILRHEDRTQDATFFSPLTKNGLENSEKLIELLKELKINLIYSSPFIRTLQTIRPYAKYKNLKINIDYSLSELQHPDLIPPNSYQVTLPKYIAEDFNYNSIYESLIKPTEFQYPEDEQAMMKRVKKILTKILTNHKNDENIIIVTHQGICNLILKIVGKAINKEKLKKLKFKYCTGKVTKIFHDDKWVFKNINWNF
jgi:2,3-bisphosphoglycerate-dependent phosphoglycerate mutase